MWWDTHAREPLARQNVLLSSAPQASSGRGVPTGRSIPPGTCPRERRSSIPRPRTTRATESSVRMWIGRSCRRKRSAIAPRRASASASS